MPAFCELVAPIPCRACGREIRNLCGEVKFLWGRVPVRDYRLGRRVEWRKNGKGEPLPPFTCTPDDLSFNRGDPQFGDLLVFDSSAEWPDYRRACDRCGFEHEGVAAVIEGGVFGAIRLFTPGEVGSLTGVPWDGGRPHEADVVIRRADGSFYPWHDRRGHDLIIRPGR